MSVSIWNSIIKTIIGLQVLKKGWGSKLYLIHGPKFGDTSIFKKIWKLKILSAGSNKSKAVGQGGSFVV